jgi:tetratricopeptide (TPR) repeat protein
VVLTTVGFVAAYWLQVGDQWIRWWSIVGLGVPPLRPADVGLTIGTANAVAAYLELLVPIAAWIAWRRWHNRAFAAALAITGLAALLVTSSRGAWLGAGAGIAAIAFVLGREAVARRRDGLTSLPRRRLAIVGAFAVILLLLIAPAVISRLFAGDAGRLELWRSAFGIFLDHPILGGGPGSWPGLRAADAISQANYAVLYTPHSIVAQLAAELGAMGLLAGAVLLVAVTRLARRAVAEANGAERVQRLIAAGSLLAVGMHAVVDPMWHIPAVVLLTFVLVARLDPPADGNALAASALAGRRDRGRALGALAVVLAGVVLLVPIDGAMIFAQAGADRLDEGDLQAAQRAYDDAISLDDRAPYRVGQAIARSGLGDTEGAIDALELAWADEPYSFIEAAVATLELASGDVDRAMERARHVAASGSYDQTASLNAAAVMWSGGEAAAAEDLLAGVFETNPGLLPSSRPENLFDDAAWERAIAEAIDRLGDTSPATAVYWAVRAGNLSAADAWQRSVSNGPERDAIALFRRAESGEPVAANDSLALLRRAPASPVVLACVDRIGELTDTPDLRDAAVALSIAALFIVPPQPYEIVVDGAPDPGLIARLPRWPNASDSRLGPARPYVAGMLTIEAAR